MEQYNSSLSGRHNRRSCKSSGETSPEKQAEMNALVPHFFCRKVIKKYCDALYTCHDSRIGLLPIFCLCASNTAAVYLGDCDLPH